VTAPTRATGYRASISSFALALGAVACSQQVAPTDPRNLDRPSDMAFACIGELVLDSGDTAFTAQPLANCFGGLDDGGADVDAGATELFRGLYAFALQPETGTVALVEMTHPTAAGVVIDSDPHVPGKNAAPVGTLPVSIVADEAGCYLSIANAGTCDLSIMDAQMAIEQEPSVSRRSVVNSNGALIDAEPRMMTAEPSGPAGNDPCGPDPTGLLYIAYPRCNAVAVVDPAGGMYQVVAAIQFAEDGTPAITDGSLACPSECGNLDATGGVGVDAGPVDAGAPDAALEPDAAPEPDAGPEPPLTGGTPRPSSVLMADDGSRLFIGAENAPMLTIVELDADRLPASVSAVALEGDIGLRRMAASGLIEMGGDLGSASFGQVHAGAFDFVYAVATDRTVRVVEVGRRIECDTQVDPRYLHDSTDAAQFACFEVGAVTTPPRRAGVTGPGIVMPRDAVPLDVVVYSNHPTGDQAITSGEGGDPHAPRTMVGHFAMVTTSDGFAHVINIDDDHYPDFEITTDPLAVDMSKAMAHQLRDAVTDRDVPAQTCAVALNALTTDSALGPRAENGMSRTFDLSFIGGDRGRFVLPRGHKTVCNVVPDVGVPTRDIVSELDIGAPIDVREQAFPDVAAARNEEFLVVWEGRLSADDIGIDVDGPPVRVGVVMKDGSERRLVDGASPFCDAGIEEYDVIQMLGCQVDAHCSLGEECVFHPESEVNTGLCMPIGLSSSLLSPCRDLLVSNKQFTAVDTFSSHVTLLERRRLLRTGPIDGCVDDAECTTAAAHEPLLLSPNHPMDDVVVPSDRTWACVDDPSRAPGPNRCVMTCGEVVDAITGEVSQCETGYHCTGAGFCVEAPLPPTSCVQALQRYDIRAGESFAVVGAVLESSRVTGYQHDRIADPDTGACIADPNASPLSVGRIPLRAPDCAGDGFADVSPNPCMTTIETAVEEEYEVTLIDDPDSADPDDKIPACTEVDPPTETVGETQLPVTPMRDVRAIRFRNRVMTLHLIQPDTPGDATCWGDEQGGLAPFSPVYPGYTMRIRVKGGFVPLFAPILAAYPARIVSGPDGNLWVLDQGDTTSGRITRGQIIRVIPSQPEGGFGVDNLFSTIL
jgi:hypothetical protein